MKEASERDEMNHRQLPTGQKLKTSLEESEGKNFERKIKEYLKLQKNN